MEERPKSRVFTFEYDRKVEVPIEDLDYIFKGMRPRLMDYEDFKAIRRILKKELAQYLKGKIVHLSKVNDSAWKEYTGGKKIKQKGLTYVKKQVEGS